MILHIKKMRVVTKHLFVDDDYSSPSSTKHRLSNALMPWSSCHRPPEMTISLPPADQLAPLITDGKISTLAFWRN